MNRPQSRNLRRLVKERMIANARFQLCGPGTVVWAVVVNRGPYEFKSADTVRLPGTDALAAYLPELTSRDVQ